jgi:ATP-binding cassette subfamily B protein
MTLGDMTMLIALIQQTGFPLRNLSFFVDSYQRAVANSKDFLEAMAVPQELEGAGVKKLTLHSPDIEFDSVSFGYGNQNNVLHSVSFKVAAGDKVALVGESGAGKSTIASLLMGLYTPNAGAVRIGGQDISGAKKADVRQSIATVFQDASLFSGTIRENIAYGRPNATDKEIMAAAKAANADTFIGKLEKGVDTEIGERGIKLSGGQKQRIAIARAILKDAPFLVLDEATSSLDSKAEHEVQEALERLMRGRTTLIIAHRLSTIASVDTIVTLKDGKVDEIGEPSQLAKTGGIYSELLQLQLHATERDKKRLAKYEISA